MRGEGAGAVERAVQPRRAHRDCGRAQVERPGGIDEQGRGCIEARAGRQRQRARADLGEAGIVHPAAEAQIRAVDQETAAGPVEIAGEAAGAAGEHQRAGAERHIARAGQHADRLAAAELQRAARQGDRSGVGNGAAIGDERAAGHGPGRDIGGSAQRPGAAARLGGAPEVRHRAQRRRTGAGQRQRVVAGATVERAVDDRAGVQRDRVGAAAASIAAVQRAEDVDHPVAGAARADLAGGRARVQIHRDQSGAVEIHAAQAAGDRAARLVGEGAARAGPQAIAAGAAGEAARVGDRAARRQIDCGLVARGHAARIGQARAGAIGGDGGALAGDQAAGIVGDRGRARDIDGGRAIERLDRARIVDRTALAEIQREIAVAGDRAARAVDQLGVAAIDPDGAGAGDRAAIVEQAVGAAEIDRDIVGAGDRAEIVDALVRTVGAHRVGAAGQAARRRHVETAAGPEEIDALEIAGAGRAADRDVRPVEHHEGAVEIVGAREGESVARRQAAHAHIAVAGDVLRDGAAIGLLIGKGAVVDDRGAGDRVARALERRARLDRGGAQPAVGGVGEDDRALAADHQVLARIHARAGAGGDRAGQRRGHARIGVQRRRVGRGRGDDFERDVVGIAAGGAEGRGRVDHVDRARAEGARRCRADRAAIDIDVAGEAAGAVEGDRAGGHAADAGIDRLVGIVARAGQRHVARDQADAVEVDEVGQADIVALPGAEIGEQPVIARAAIDDAGDRAAEIGEAVVAVAQIHVADLAGAHGDIVAAGGRAGVVIAIDDARQVDVARAVAGRHDAAIHRRADLVGHVDRAVAGEQHRARGADERAAHMVGDRRGLACGGVQRDAVAAAALDGARILDRRRAAGDYQAVGAADDGAAIIGAAGVGHRAAGREPNAVAGAVVLVDLPILGDRVGRGADGDDAGVVQRLIVVAADHAAGAADDDAGIGDRVRAGRDGDAITFGDDQATSLVPKRAADHGDAAIVGVGRADQAGIGHDGPGLGEDAVAEIADHRGAMGDGHARAAVGQRDRVAVAPDLDSAVERQRAVVDGPAADVRRRAAQRQIAAVEGKLLEIADLGEVERGRGVDAGVEPVEADGAGFDAGEAAAIPVDRVVAVAEHDRAIGDRAGVEADRVVVVAGQVDRIIAAGDRAAVVDVHRGGAARIDAIIAADDRRAGTIGEVAAVEDDAAAGATRREGARGAARKRARADEAGVVDVHGGAALDAPALADDHAARLVGDRGVAELLIDAAAPRAGADDIAAIVDGHARASRIDAARGAADQAARLVVERAPGSGDEAHAIAQRRIGAAGNRASVVDGVAGAQQVHAGIGRGGNGAVVAQAQRAGRADADGARDGAVILVGDAARAERETGAGAEGVGVGRRVVGRRGDQAAVVDDPARQHRRASGDA